LEPLRVLQQIEDITCGGPLAPHDVHERWTTVLIDVGAMESALLDARHPNADGWDEDARALRRLSEHVGDAFVASWNGRMVDTECLHATVQSARFVMPSLPLETRVPEGFAYYGLMPETYADAAYRFQAETGASHVVVIGIRSIGTSLSAVVAAALRSRAECVESFTVRPRGHPFDRELRVAPTLSREWDEKRSWWFAIVDEGPGLSGSSFAATSRALEEAGVPPEHIALFPSWDPAADALRSERARSRWNLHRRYLGNFDDLWLRSGRLVGRHKASALRDLSGGRWRTVMYANEREHPAVQPQHEQRKLQLIRDERPSLLLKFVGIGSLGRPRLEVAESLTNAGFFPGPVGLHDGFLVLPWVEGRVQSRQDLSPELVRELGRYLGWRSSLRTATAGTSPDSMLAMIEENVREGLGASGSAAAAAAHLERWRRVLEDAQPVITDGHMMPHEWLRTGGGDRWAKADGVSHHDDHFLPGCQDIAWDVAGAIEEWGLAHAQRALLLSTYSTASGDSTIEQRLPIWRAAYLAYRLGYTSLAVEALGVDADGRRMGAARRRYARRLRVALRRLANAA
jgi:hypothetical protein